VVELHQAAGTNYRTWAAGVIGLRALLQNENGNKDATPMIVARILRINAKFTEDIRDIRDKGAPD
jgi:hypothetical protein